MSAARNRATETTMAKQAFDASLARLRASADELDAVRLRMRANVDPGDQDDVFDGEVTGVTALPAVAGARL